MDDWMGQRPEGRRVRVANTLVAGDVAAAGTAALRGGSKSWRTAIRLCCDSAVAKAMADKLADKLTQQAGANRIEVKSWQK
jgi:hypothetical protein